MNIICDIDGTLADLTHRLHFIRPQVGDTFMDGKIERIIHTVDPANKTVKVQHSEWVAFTYKDISFEPDWDAFHANVKDDSAITVNCDAVRGLAIANDMIFVTGRMEKCRADTVEWLQWADVWYGLNIDRLYMRNDGDYRPDFEVKLDILKKLRKRGWCPDLAIDDRQQVVDMWRSEGIPCWQVADGKY